MRFGRLVAISERKKDNRPAYDCVCDCGNVRIIRHSDLLRGHNKSCGCGKGDLISENKTVHGFSRRKHRGGKAPEYKIWCGIITRCLNKSDQAYPEYGGRGIGMHQQWVDSFEEFLSDVGPRPSKHHSIDRIDNNRGYEPGNVRWATRTDQANNRRSNMVLIFNGREGTLASFAKEVGKPYHTVKARLRYGWSVEAALMTPVRAIRR